ncbi:alpha/beta-hydrolase [Lojkania enalia]|uniref:Alpha/beta-hydrolase n=1 Tax=Lojkania enalia TaxID=147567 RepID=A0A9P4K632_9PLEO|nr:alpha/beta-hydrolase [Didymosphaeria enalia]
MKIFFILGIFVLYVRSAIAVCTSADACNDPAILGLETSECQDYHVFTTRGSTSPYPGHQAGLIWMICQSLGDCGYENIIYPAETTTSGRNAWCESAATGAAAGQKQLTEYSERCPDSKLIVVGFSQGASVTLDYLGGGGGPAFECVQAENPALDRTTIPGSNIVAAIVFGSYRRSANQTYSVKGGSVFDGSSPRTEEQLDGLNQYAGILRDYCNAGDPICTTGSEPEDIAQHLNYFDEYNDEAADWVIKTAQRALVGDGDAADASRSDPTSQPTSQATSRATSRVTSQVTSQAAGISTSVPSTPLPTGQGFALVAPLLTAYFATAFIVLNI